jgi:hypothetical protein
MWLHKGIPPIFTGAGCFDAVKCVCVFIPTERPPGVWMRGLQGKYSHYACITRINGLIPKILIARFRL